MENDYQEALEYHEKGKPGKISIVPTKPLSTQKDLSLAYSPGVAGPCLAISENINNIYKYTSRGNSVAVISNGTAVLGLGNLGAAASKPVMEGKAVLFKKFANINSIDIEVSTKDPEEFITVVKNLEYSFGGINLEDIKAPECFIIEKRLKELMDIPVFHDDQHGTAVTILAGLLNAADLTVRKLSDLRIVINGAGSAGIACANLLLQSGVALENIILCDTKGVIYQERIEGMNEWKKKFATKRKERTLEESVKWANVFIGLSKKDTMTQQMVASMEAKPIIFAMANPDPEITPAKVYEVRQDAIIATGRSDYINQINNVLCFPYIFRGALDTRAKIINDEMKIAAAHAIAKLAKLFPPDNVIKAYPTRKLDVNYGPKFIVPLPLDNRLLVEVSFAVAEAAIRTGVTRNESFSIENYKLQLQSIL